MQIEPRFAHSLDEESAGIATTHEQQTFLSVNQTRTTVAPRAAKLDLVSAAVVVGLTAQFVTFIFGLVTEFVPRLFDNILLSIFIGLCVGVIAFALMKGND